MNQDTEAAMADQAVVESETIDANVAEAEKVKAEAEAQGQKVLTRTGIVIGWADDGTFLVGCVDPTISPVRGLWYLLEAQQILMRGMNPDRKPESKIVGASMVPPLPPGLKIGG